jgi:hypothetical protein
MVRRRPAVRHVDDFLMRAVEERDWPAIMAIEHDAYEPARRDSSSTCAARRSRPRPRRLRRASGEISASASAPRSSAFRRLRAPTGRSTRPRRHLLLRRHHRRRVRRAPAGSVARSSAPRRWAQERGFAYISGRNRVGATDAMAAINKSFGAFNVMRLTHQYEGHAFADYYRIPLGPPPPPPRPAARRLRLRASSSRSAGARVHGDARARRPDASRLNLSNYATIDTVHYSEHLQLARAARHLAHVRDHLARRDARQGPALPAPQRARAPARHRPRGRLRRPRHRRGALALGPRGFGPDLALFPWPRIPHPSKHGSRPCARARRAWSPSAAPTRSSASSPRSIGERSGLVLEGDGARALAIACRATIIPLMLVETASGCYRSGDGAWGVDTLYPLKSSPDLVLWYPGGQIGHIFVGDRYYVKTPLVPDLDLGRRRAVGDPRPRAPPGGAPPRPRPDDSRPRSCAPRAARPAPQRRHDRRPRPLSRAHLRRPRRRYRPPPGLRAPRPAPRPRPAWRRHLRAPARSHP